MNMPPEEADARDDSLRVNADPFDGADWGTEESAVELGTAPRYRRRRRTSRQRLRRRRRLGLAMLVVGGFIVLVGLYLLATGLLARSQLNSVRAEVTRLHQQVGQGNLAGARASARAIASRAHRADDLTSGPVWALGAAVPGDGNPVRTARIMTEQVDALGTEVLPRLVAASTQLDPATLRAPDGTIRLARISAAVPTLDRALRAMRHTTNIIAARPAHTWFGPVDNARTALLTQLRSLAKTIKSADLAARIAPPMLGQDGLRRYFVAFQNEAEARGTGGLPGAFAILRAEHGKISFERFEPDGTLQNTKVKINLGSGYNQLYGNDPTHSLYVNGNVSPHFPYAAKIWSAMWAKYSGEKVDGVIAVDPTLLSYLLRVTGPVTLPGHVVVSYRNLVSLTQSGIYARFPQASQNQARKMYLLEIAKAVSRKIVDSRASDLSLVHAAAEGAGQRRLLVYSADSGVQAELQQTSLAGAIPQTSAPYVGLVVVNGGQNKLDYYLHRSLTWTRMGCGARREVTVTVKLRNAAPASGLSPYVTGVDPRAHLLKRPGDNRLNVTYFATRGAQLNSVQVNGKPTTSGVAEDLGHTVLTVRQELPRGTTQTIVWHLTEPAGIGKPIVLTQPLIIPLMVRLRDAKC